MYPHVWDIKNWVRKKQLVKGNRTGELVTDLSLPGGKRVKMGGVLGPLKDILIVGMAF